MFALDASGLLAFPQCRESIFSSEIQQGIIIPVIFFFSSAYTPLPRTVENPDEPKEDSHVDVDNPGRARPQAEQVRGSQGELNLR